MIKIVANLPPPPKPSVECPQRCASCWHAPTCQALKEHLSFAKEIPAAQSFKKICRAEDRSEENFHRCLECKNILTCEILKRSRTPAQSPKPDWFVEHGLLKSGENFSLLKVLQRLIKILTAP